ncbi:LOW QUALITY PROTEIN: IL5 isoform 1, partial [Pongo abelii]
MGVVVGWIGDPGRGTLRIPVPVHKNHQLCTEEIFQGIGTLESQTVQGGTVE